MFALPSFSMPSMAGQGESSGVLPERLESLLEIGDLFARLVGVVVELLLQLVALSHLFELAKHL